MLPRIRDFEGPTVFFRLNAAAYFEFSTCPMRRLYKGGVCFKITFLKSLTTVTLNLFFFFLILCTLKVPMSPYFSEIES